jgi:hypothetical protein
MADFTDLEPIKELYLLWKPVYPYIAEELAELQGKPDGTVAEVGPFCGAIFSLRRNAPGGCSMIATFPGGMGRFYLEEAKTLQLDKEVGIIETDPSFQAISEGSIDLLLFRGAFFFPSLFSPDFRTIYRLLSRGGRALVGGGFGRRTPLEVITAIGRRSRDLNFQVGKIQIETEDLSADLEKCGLSHCARIITTGGLWVILEKP